MVFDAIRDYANGGAFPTDSRINVFTPFVDPSVPQNPQFKLLSTQFADENSGVAVASTPSLYQIFPGPGGADESYDAADYQNMALALQAAQPRERARVVASVDANGDGVLDRVDPTAYYASGSPAAPERLDLTGLAIPSFHRPALVNYWFHRIMNSDWLQAAIASPSLRALAILEPYDVNDRDGDGDRTELNPQASGLTVAVARRLPR